MKLTKHCRPPLKQQWMKCIGGLHWRVTPCRLFQGWGGIGTEVFLSLPCIMGASGSTRLAGVSLGQEEDSKLRDSVSSLSNLMSQLRIWRTRLLPQFWLDRPVWEQQLLTGWAVLQSIPPQRMDCAEVWMKLTTYNFDAMDITAVVNKQNLIIRFVSILSLDTVY